MITKEKILGVNIDFGVTKLDILHAVDYAVSSSTHTLICTTNAEFIVSAYEDRDFMNIINSCYFSIPDGVGPILAKDYLAKVKNLPKDNLYKLKACLIGLSLGFSYIFSSTYRNSSSRVLGRELIYDLCAYAASKGYNIFLLGGWKKDSFGRMALTSGDIASKASKILKNKYSNLNVIGATSDFSFRKSDDDKTIAYIKDCLQKNEASQVDILLVAYNHINQEKWVLRNADKIPAKLCVGIGGTLDYVSGNYMTPPQFVSYCGLEWLYKMFVQPWRFSRIFNATIKFCYLIYKSTL